MTFLNKADKQIINSDNATDNNPSGKLNIRESFQEREKVFLSQYGSLSSESRGRAEKEESCSIRTPYQLDKDRIVYSNAFRRLKHKTQVFLSPLGDHFRTRLTHTLEVSEIARNIARAMRMNEDLAEAVALGHDLGHTPFGHGGEAVLKEIYSKGFSHSKQSLRVIDRLENNGKGLNLSKEVRDGILKHSKGFGDIIPTTPGDSAFTIEGKIVRIADIIAYLNHDLDDALRGGVITFKDVPEICNRKLGTTHSARAKTMMETVIYNSRPHNDTFELKIGDDILEAMIVLRKFLYDNVYRSGVVHKEFTKAKKILTELFNYFINHETQLQKELEKMEMAQWEPSSNSLKKSACDLIASMTDRYALEVYERVFFPSSLV
jgi:dGTPase